MESTKNSIYSWSDEVLCLFLKSRSVVVPAGSSHGTLVAMAQKHREEPIQPIPNTPISSLSLWTLAHLRYFIAEKRGYPVNIRAKWRQGTPPKSGHMKRNALLEFARNEYEAVIRPNKEELRKFDGDVADTLRIRIALTDENPLEVFLQQDDIEYAITHLLLLDPLMGGLRDRLLTSFRCRILYKTWGIPLNPTWTRAEALGHMQKSLDIFATGKV